MLSSLTPLFIGCIITTASALCPYAANYEWSYKTDDGLYSYGSMQIGARIINECQTYDVLIDEIMDQNDTISLTASKLICDNNDQVYINFYADERCEDIAALHIEIEPLSNETSGYGVPYQYSCEDSGCTNYFKWRPSNQSLHSLNYSSPPETCIDPGLDDYVDVLSGIPTDVCIEYIDLDTDEPISYKVTCNATGGYGWKYMNTSECDRAPVLHQFVPTEGCMEANGSILEFGKVMYCGDVESNPTTTDSEDDEMDGAFTRSAMQVLQMAIMILCVFELI